MQINLDLPFIYFLLFLHLESAVALSAFCTVKLRCDTFGDYLHLLEHWSILVFRHSVLFCKARSMPIRRAHKQRKFCFCIFFFCWHCDSGAAHREGPPDSAGPAERENFLKNTIIFFQKNTYFWPKRSPPYSLNYANTRRFFSTRRLHNLDGAHIV